ncbi:MULTISPECIES: hypothetical protein [Burkholderia cepacia complex]|uniref:hypothetical protein n=1 Tax=Burkholderia cepacia complex TaxID=87882 RepID=UPI0015892D9F|nr:MULTISPECIES: hypothetical protein [Burkholderia cepacia complex]MBR8426391.1 hypothetical protein [Burkholderia cenocepacia]MBR8500839.1 hypothetical protein [Burkholderia cenocepacia]MCA8081385.1 hypothetical protein [Burkholderia cepacia]
MSTSTRTVTRLFDLFTPEQLEELDNAPLLPSGVRHPSWFPLCAREELRVVDILVHESVPRIAQETGGEAWLKDLVDRLLNLQDESGASSALAEIRAYGGLLEAGFTVTPIIRRSDATPDFSVDAGDGPVTVEVFQKHQDKEQDNLVAAVNTPNGQHPYGIERSEITEGDRTVRTTVTVLTPGGRPDPKKEGDSVQANLISRVCGMKPDESQVDPDRPCVLVADFTNFGGAIASQLVTPHQTSPLIRGSAGRELCSGGMWYGVYGWRDAPVFEDQSGPKRMGHDGRFRLEGKKKSRLSAILFVFHEDVVLLENPWAPRPLPPLARFAFSCYPYFNMPFSIADWHPGNTLAIVEAQRRMIEAFDA